MPPILIIPGRGGSAEAHWQSWLERALPATRRVLQDDWDNPDPARWAERVDAAARAFAEPPLAVAHSFGCLALAHAASRFCTPLAGSFLVAPADPRRFGIGDESILVQLDHPSDLIASTNDPWLACERTRHLADAWGSRLHVLGAVGHINVDSGFGPWPDMLRWAQLGYIDHLEQRALACEEGMDLLHELSLRGIVDNDASMPSAAGATMSG